LPSVPPAREVESAGDRRDSVSVVGLIPENYFAPLDLLKIYGRNAPLHVDLGCGDGMFLFALAQQRPEKDFLGTERLLHRVKKACRKAEKIDNMRVLRIESAYAVRHLLPAGSVEMFHLLFPDPWEKRRHHQRRIVGLDFLRDVHTALTPEGVLRVVTDHREYFEQIQEVAARTEKFELVEENGADYPPSRFEEQFQQRGVEIHRLELRKISPVT
jgi:tRNA (guanine-N7-)-methyltransferase